MPVLRIDTTEGVRLEREIAGAGARSAAMIVDIMLVTLLVLAVALLARFAKGTAIGDYFLGLVAGGSILAVVGYFTVLPTLALDGRTPGKSALGLRVTGVTGQSASGLQHLLRSLLLIVELALWLPIPVGLYLIALNPKRRRLGDLVAGTVVLYDPLPESPEPWARDTWSELEQRLLPLERGMASRITDDEFEHLRRVVTRRGLDVVARRKILVQTARHFAQKLELGRFDDARVFLRELYLFAREMRQARAS